MLNQTLLNRRKALRINEALVYSSILINIVLMAILTAKYFACYKLPEVQWIKQLTSLVDPFLVFLFTCAMLYIQIYNYLSNLPILPNTTSTANKQIPKAQGSNAAHPANPNRYKAKLVSNIIAILVSIRNAIPYKARLHIKLLCILSAIVVVGYIVGDKLLKPAFNYTRTPSPEQLGEPWFTCYFTGSIRTGSDSCPSGFIVRQVYIYLSALLFINQNNGTLLTQSAANNFLRVARSYNSPDSIIKPSTFVNKVFLLLQTLSILYVCFVRIYRGAHTFFDIGVALGTATYSYWILVCLVQWVARVDRKYIPDMHYISLFFIPLCFFYSKDAIKWTYTALTIIIILSVMYIFPNKFNNTNRTEDNSNDITPISN